MEKKIIHKERKRLLLKKENVEKERNLIEKRLEEIDSLIDNQINLPKKYVELIKSLEKEMFEAWNNNYPGNALAPGLHNSMRILGRCAYDSDKKKILRKYKWDKDCKEFIAKMKKEIEK